MCVCVCVCVCVFQVTIFHANKSFVRAYTLTVTGAAEGADQPGEVGLPQHRGQGSSGQRRQAAGGAHLQSQAQTGGQSPCGCLTP